MSMNIEYIGLFLLALTLVCVDHVWAKEVVQSFRSELERWRLELDERGELAWASPESALKILDRRLRSVPRLAPFEKIQVVAPLVGVVYGAVRLVLGSSALTSDLGEIGNIALGVLLGAVLGIIHAYFAGRVGSQAAYVTKEAEEDVRSRSMPGDRLRALEGEVGSAFKSLSQLNKTTPELSQSAMEFSSGFGVSTAALNLLVKELEQTRIGIAESSATSRDAQLAMQTNLLKTSAELHEAVRALERAVQLSNKSLVEAVGATVRTTDNVSDALSRSAASLQGEVAGLSTATRDTVDSMHALVVKSMTTVDELMDGARSLQKRAEEHDALHQGSVRQIIESSNTAIMHVGAQIASDRAGLIAAIEQIAERIPKAGPQEHKREGPDLTELTEEVNRIGRLVEEYVKRPSMLARMWGVIRSKTRSFLEARAR